MMNRWPMLKYVYLFNKYIYCSINVYYNFSADRTATHIGVIMSTVHTLS